MFTDDGILGDGMFGDGLFGIGMFDEAEPEPETAGTPIGLLLLLTKAS